ncbi:MAG: hypothetical protein IJZ53_02710 [Tyzzerella sp.]|nr:hypothetical protein [Tyzzerella sp.]
MKEKLKTVLRCLFWFVLSFILLWVTGIGLLFESIDPIRALVAFSVILTVIFEAINRVDVEARKKIEALEKRVEELEK